MIIDGKKIAADIYETTRREITVLGRSPVLAIFTCAPNFETTKYLVSKQRKAEAIGITLNIIKLPHETSTEAFIKEIQRVLSSCDGAILQLPIPAHIDTEVLLSAIPPTHDVDGLNPKTTEVVPAVVGACKAILERYAITLKEKQVTVLGSGRLVGGPVAKWFDAEGAVVRIVTKETMNIPSYTKNADIIVCGAGDPGFLKPDMIKEGSIILDAGTSEDGGVLTGDADPSCAQKALLFTPVPGGIGPITVAVLLSNVVLLAKQGKSDIVVR